jgi:sortase B
MVFAVLALLLALSLMAYAGLRLYEIDQIYREGNDAYDKIGEKVRTLPADGSGAPSDVVYASEAGPVSEQAAEKKPLVEIPALNVNFENLKRINGDSVAWLYSPGTVIDYPVMKATDYSHYLYRLPDGTRNANGTLFIDYNNPPDFSSELTVIYGHHMKSGRMFGNLAGYKAQNYYDEHPYMYLYTESGNYRVDILYGCVIGAGQWRERAFMYADNIKSLISYASHNSTFTSAAAYKPGDKVVALSTCSYEFDEARYVVLGVLRAEY